MPESRVTTQMHAPGHRGQDIRKRDAASMEFFGGLSEFLISHLSPRTVWDAADENSFLAEAFRDRGAQAASYHPTATYDLVTCIDAFSDAGNEDSRQAVRQMAAVTGTIFFSPAASEHWGAWFDLFAEFGFHPDAGHPVTPLLPEAVLFRRHDGALTPELREFYCELFANRGIILRIHSRNEELSRKAEHLSNEKNALSRQLDLITRSPAWQLILSYRQFLAANHNRARWLERIWSPLAWTFRRAGLLTQPAPPPVNQEREARMLGYEAWYTAAEPSAEDLDAQRRASEQHSYRPKISVVLPVHRVPVPVLRETLDSVIAQTYSHWELCIAYAPAEDSEVDACLSEYSLRDPRILLNRLAANEGISGNTNRALALATGEYAAMLDHDDTIAPFAFHEVVCALNQDPAIDAVYSDRDEMLPSGRRIKPFLKPRFSPEIMLNTNILTHLCVVRTAIIRTLGGWRSECDGAQDWDLYYRLSRQYSNIRHIPKILYHWRQIPTSIAMRGLDAKPWAAAGMVRAAQEHVNAIFPRPAGVEGNRSGLRILWPAPNPADQVSVILLTAPDRPESGWAEKIVAGTAFENVEFLAPESRTARPAAGIKPVPAASDATLEEKMESAVAAGSVLVFLDEAVTPRDPNWLAEIYSPLQLNGVGISGGRMVDPATGLLRHCGIVIAKDGRIEYFHAGCKENEEQYAGDTMWYRNWSAVSGACFGIRREVWNSLGGLSGVKLHGRLDVNLCLRLQVETGLRIFYNPFASFHQPREAAIESWYANTRIRVSDSFRVRFPHGDPFLNPNLDCRDGRLVLSVPTDKQSRQ